MTDLLYDAVARIARHEADARSWITVGTVTDVHLAVAGGPDHAVSVQLRDSAVVVPRLPLAVGALGLTVPPAVGDVVVVAFAEGDPHAGIVIGRLYSRDTAPPEHAEGQAVLSLPPGGSPSVKSVIDPGIPEVTLTVGDTTVTLRERTATIEIGGTRLELSDDGSGSARLAVGDAELSLSGSGDVSLKTSGSLTLKATQVQIEGTGKVAISGAMVEVN